VQTLKRAYQQADAETMLRVVLEAGELREAKWTCLNMHTNMHRWSDVPVKNVPEMA